MRYVLSCFVIAVFVAVGVSGVAMAANDLGHQMHCLDASADVSQGTVPEHAHDHQHNHDGIVAQHASQGHDHETCMIHACPALSADAITLSELKVAIFTKVTWPEPPLLTLEIADGLKRPPKS